MKRHITPEEAGDILNVSADHIRALIKQGALRASNIGRGRKLPRYMISPDELEAFIRQRQTQQPTKRRHTPFRKEVKQYV